MRERLPFPFVVGCGRSGTTLVRAMLDAHPALAIPDESYFAVWLGRNRSRYERPEGFATARFLDDVSDFEWFQHWGLEIADVRAAFAANPPCTFADAVRTCFACYATAHGKPRYGDKTPIFVQHIPMLAEMFPEAVFVHVVRDGRDVVLSRIEASWGTERLDHEALQWRSHIEKGRSDGVALGGRRYREVHYEDLLDDPERVARELCDFAALDFDPAMLRYHERATPLVGTLAIPQEHQNLFRPPTKGLRDWREQLSPAQVALFEELAGDTLEAFGYDRVTTAAPASVRAQALRARARYVSLTQYRRARGAVWRAVHPGVDA